MEYPFFNEFKFACEQICSDLDIDFQKATFSSDVTPKIGFDYIGSGGTDSNYFNFHLRTVTDKDDVSSGKMTASIEIIYSESASSFYFDENIDYIRGHPNFLGRLAAWVVSKYNYEHHPVNLDSLFHEMDIKTYGLPDLTNPTSTEINIFLNGLSSMKINKLLIYKFRHAENNFHYRSFSYAFFPIFDNLNSLWIFFPRIGALDSGAASRDLNEVEELISKLDIDKEEKRFDIEYEKLAKFLDDNALETFGRKTVTEETLKFLGLDKHSSSFGKSFDESYEKITKHLDEKEISDTLRELRILVQESLESLCDQNSIDLGGDNERTIKKLVEKLITHDILDEELRNWFTAFSSIANKSAHRTYPGKYEEQDHELMRRIGLTIGIGMNLLSELEKLVKK